MIDRIKRGRIALFWVVVFSSLAGSAHCGELATPISGALSTGVRPPHTRPKQPPGLGPKEILAWQKGWALYESRVQLRESLKGASAADLKTAFQTWDQAHKADITELLRLQKEAAPETAARLDAVKAP